MGSNTPVTYGYNEMGNITSRSDVNGGATWTYHGTKKHAVATTGSGGSSYSYDANGNMTSRAGSTITWASYNYPTGLATGTESATFYYGPDRQYYRQVYTGPASPTGYEETHYVGGILEKVSDGAVTDWRHYIRAEGQVVAIVSRPSSGSPAVHYPLEDNQGSGSTLVDSAGTGYVRQSYGAFGLPRDGADWDGAVPGGDQSAINAITRRGYTGHSMLGAMGLIHMNGRVQDAVTGRFLSPDPTIPNPGFTQSFNRYAYVYNNPLSYIDPSGFNPDLPELPTVNVNGDRCRNGAFPEYCDYYAGPPPPAQADPYCESNYSQQCYESLGEEGAGVVDGRAEMAAAARNAVAGILGWIKCRADPNCRTQKASPQGKTDWEQVAKDWWPGYQLGTCIYESFTGGKCGAGKWTLATIGVVPIPAGKGINIAEKGLAHALANHGSGVFTGAKSVFHAGEDVVGLVRSASGVERMAQRGGNFERVVDAGRTIGIDRVTGQPTSIYTVITNAADDLVTTFPGFPP